MKSITAFGWIASLSSAVMILSSGCASTVDSRLADIGSAPARNLQIGVSVEDVDTSRAERFVSGSVFKMSYDDYAEDVLAALVSESKGNVDRDSDRPVRLSVSLVCRPPTAQELFGDQFLWSLLSFLPPFMFIPVRQELDYSASYRLTAGGDNLIHRNNFTDKAQGHHTGWYVGRIKATEDLAKKEAQFAAVNSARMVVADIFANADKINAAVQKVVEEEQALSELKKQLAQNRGALLPTAAAISLPGPTWEVENVAVADLNAFSVTTNEALTLGEQLRTSLVQTKYFRIVSRNDMVAVLEEQNFQRSGACDDSQCLVEMGKLLAVRKIVGGTIGRVGDTFSVTVRMVEVETGEILFTSSRKAKGEVDQLIDLIDTTARDLCSQYAGAKSKGSPAGEGR